MSEFNDLCLKLAKPVGEAVEWEKWYQFIGRFIPLLSTNQYDVIVTGSSVEGGKYYRVDDVGDLDVMISSLQPECIQNNTSLEDVLEYPGFVRIVQYSDSDTKSYVPTSDLKSDKSSDIPKIMSFILKHTASISDIETNLEVKKGGAAHAFEFGASFPTISQQLAQSEQPLSTQVQKSFISDMFDIIANRYGGKNELKLRAILGSFEKFVANPENKPKDTTSLVNQLESIVMLAANTPKEINNINQSNSTMSRQTQDNSPCATDLTLDNVPSCSTLEPDDVPWSSSLAQNNASSSGTLSQTDISASSALEPYYITSSSNILSPDGVPSSGSLSPSDVLASNTLALDDGPFRSILIPDDVQSNSTLSLTDVSAGSTLAPYSITLAPANGAPNSTLAVTELPSSHTTQHKEHSDPLFSILRIDANRKKSLDSSSACAAESDNTKGTSKEEFQSKIFDQLFSMDPSAPDDVEEDFTVRSEKKTRIGGLDIVLAFKCMDWPLIATGWKERDRQWPDKDTVLKIIGNGVHLVAKPPKGINSDNIFRLSFSLAETVLCNAMNSTQLNCYRLLKVLHIDSLKEKVSSLNEKTKERANSSSKFSSYHLKTVLFWLCEETDQESWTVDKLGDFFILTLFRLQEALEKRYLAHFFVGGCNLFADFAEKEFSRMQEILTKILGYPLDSLIQLENGILHATENVTKKIPQSGSNDITQGVVAHDLSNKTFKQLWGEKYDELKKECLRYLKDDVSVDHSDHDKYYCTETFRKLIGKNLMTVEDLQTVFVTLKDMMYLRHAMNLKHMNRDLNGLVWEDIRRLSDLASNCADLNLTGEESDDKLRELILNGFRGGEEPGIDCRAILPNMNEVFQSMIKLYFGQW